MKRTIAHAWERYVQQVLETNGPLAPDELHRFKLAFYGGAFIHDILMLKACEAESDVEAEAAVEALHMEIETFNATVRMEALGIVPS